MTAAIKAKEQQYARFCKAGNLKQKINRLYVNGYKRDFAYIKPIKGFDNKNVVSLGKGEKLNNLIEKQGVERVNWRYFRKS